MGVIVVVLKHVLQKNIFNVKNMPFFEDTHFNCMEQLRLTIHYSLQRSESHPIPDSVSSPKPISVHLFLQGSGLCPRDTDHAVTIGHTLYYAL